MFYYLAVYLQDKTLFSVFTIITFAKKVSLKLDHSFAKNQLNISLYHDIGLPLYHASSEIKRHARWNIFKSVGDNHITAKRVFKGQKKSD